MYLALDSIAEVSLRNLSVGAADQVGFFGRPTMRQLSWSRIPAEVRCLVSCRMFSSHVFRLPDSRQSGAGPLELSR
jgi:hypothetical protein